MEILFISHKYPPDVGGMQKQSYELIKAFEKDFVVHKLVLVPEQNRIAFFGTLEKKVKKLLSIHPGISLIHCNDGLCAYFCRKYQSKFNIPVVVTFHGLDLLWPNYFYRKTLLNYKKFFSAFICVSDFTSNQCATLLETNKNIYTVYNGVDYDVNFDQDELNNDLISLVDKWQSSKVIVSIGRPTKRKGFAWFGDYILPHLGDDYIYVLIGKEQKLNIVLRAIRKIFRGRALEKIDLFLGYSNDQVRLNELEKSNDNLLWLKQCSFNDLLFILRKADLFVMPNIEVNGDAEGFGLVALEGVVQKCPVFASKVDGIPSAIKNNKNGYLLSPLSEEEWITKIKSFFSLDETLVSNHVESAYKYTFENYSWSKMAEEYKKVFQSVVTMR